MIQQPLQLPLPSSDEIHVWSFSLDLPTSDLVELERLLAPDEYIRAERLQRTELRSRFVACRGLIRRVLHRYVGMRPEAITFAYGPNGKPILTNSGSLLEFNLTHSLGQALVAIAQQPVGIDMEFVGDDLDNDTIATSVYSSLELAAFRNTSEQDRNRMFYALWVRKEAVMKATGKGFTGIPTDFSVVPNAAGIPMRVLGIGQPNNNSRWHVYDLDVEFGFVAALAVDGDGSQRISYFGL